MPVFRSGEGQAPAWCELRYFDIVALHPGQKHIYERAGPKEKVIVGRGACRIRTEGRRDGGTAGTEGTQVDLASPEGAFAVDEVTEPAVLIRMAGVWGEEVGGSGLFGGREVENPTDRGDPVSYQKRTGFDRHFHDCDEYWIFFEGRGVADSEGKHYEVGPGDCLATGMGHHHDLPIIHEPVRAVFFETTLEGQKRRGHLWEHTHGPAEPKPDRV